MALLTVVVVVDVEDGKESHCNVELALGRTVRNYAHVNPSLVICGKQTADQSAACLYEQPESAREQRSKYLFFTKKMRDCYLSSSPFRSSRSGCCRGSPCRRRRVVLHRFASIDTSVSQDELQ